VTDVLPVIELLDVALNATDEEETVEVVLGMLDVLLELMEDEELDHIPLELEV